MINGKKYAAIVLAAGSGSRMHSAVPKQYMQIGGYPLVYYSLKAFENSKVDQVILVTAEKDITFCVQEIIKKYHLKKVTAVVAGGTERYLSVYEGLKAAEEPDYVLIHDGARPLLDVTMIETAIEAVEKEQACVFAVPVKDTIKVSGESGYAVETPDRSTLWSVQTPQNFSYRLIMEAYQNYFCAREKGESLPVITDDAMLVEQMTGHKVKLLLGKYENLKVTTPEDIKIAELFLER